VGVYERADSRFFWLLLERPGQPPLKESSKVPRRGATPDDTKRLRRNAEEIYHTRMTELARARYRLPSEVAPAAITFEVFARWYDTHKIDTHRGAERDREMLPLLVAFFGAYGLHEIDDVLVTEYETHRTTTVATRDRLGRPAQRKTPAKPSTVNREVDLLKSMIAAAVPRYLEASPIAGRRRLRTVKVRKRVLEAHEEPLLLAQLAPRDQVLYIAGVDTLVRMGDILDWQRADDYGDHLEVLDPKAGAAYTVPISARLRAGLDGLPKGKLAGDAPYFFWWRRRAATARDRRGSVRTMLRRACWRAGIPYGRAIAGITWHTGTRATGATRMLRLGADPKTVQEIGHWASLEQMSDYLTTTTSLQRSAVELLGTGFDLAATQQAGAMARADRISRKDMAPRGSRKAQARCRTG
jgi:hypothetical protein